MYACWTLGHIPRYMGRTSNNNKILINNSLCFAIQVVYIQITITWDMRYIDEGFLIWIIPSMYLSHEAVIWVVLLVLPYLLSSGFYSYIQFYYYYYDIIYSWFYHLCTTPLISLYYHIVHNLSLALYYTRITMPNLLTSLFMALYGFFSYRMITAPDNSYCSLKLLFWTA